ncbi:methyltransferase type 11 [Clostridium botulinum]|nr:methyltransferase type 11 [Clostridium botulinum]NFA16672.1 methyltransferase type 11 [Clostridium botulinum]NFA51749.1 methyltransferase type 11 [Clostridium botulinum]NFA65547.1 methyltransferase type 11 [Clostridium botulinum]NFE14282.1 methyltransferase type 11 [Clostridium botulinum]
MSKPFINTLIKIFSLSNLIMRSKLLSIAIKPNNKKEKALIP